MLGLSKDCQHCCTTKSLTKSLHNFFFKLKDLFYNKRKKSANNQQPNYSDYIFEQNNSYSAPEKKVFISTFIEFNFYYFKIPNFLLFFPFYFYHPSSLPSQYLLRGRPIVFLIVVLPGAPALASNLHFVSAVPNISSFLALLLPNDTPPYLL